MFQGTVVPTVAYETEFKPTPQLVELAVHIFAPSKATAVGYPSKNPTEESPKDESLGSIIKSLPTSWGVQLQVTPTKTRPIAISGLDVPQQRDHDCRPFPSLALTREMLSELTTHKSSPSKEIPAGALSVCMADRSSASMELGVHHLLSAALRLPRLSDWSIVRVVNAAIWARLTLSSGL